MHWIEATIHTTAQGADIISNLLCEAGAAGTQIIDKAEVANLPQDQGMWDLIDELVIQNMPEDVLVKAYFAQNAAATEALALVGERLLSLRAMDIGLPLGSLAMESSIVHEEDWAEHWKQYYKPFRAGQRLVVKPSWEAYAAQHGDLVIEMDPGMAFGTGTHPTTKLSLFALEQVLRGGETVLDVGTGSGVLSIAAALLGAGEIYAYDLDDVAVRVARDNIALNPDVERIFVASNDLLGGLTQKADIIVANILADILFLMIDDAYRLIKPEGSLILSGLISEKLQLVLDKALAVGFQLETQMQQGNWHCLVLKKSEKELFFG